MLALAALLSQSTLAYPPVENPELAVARQSFAQAERLCRLDGGKLWGQSLCGPILIVDPQTRKFVANQDGVNVALHPEGGAFTGALPTSLPIANTSVSWNGRDWAMVMSPLPEDSNERAILLLHESWHRIQARLGFPSVSVDEDHLATVDGRVGMRLELRALARALRSSGASRRAAVTDALIFRAWRRTLSNEANANENALELHEGLAEYSGRRLSGDPAMVLNMSARLDQGDGVTSYARSFAYYTGPAYGMLLDDANTSWRADPRKIHDLGAMLAAADGIAMPANLPAAVSQSGQRYGRAVVLAEEQKAGEVRVQANARWIALLATGPVIRVPVGSANVAFDPRTVVPLPPYGTVYPTITVAGVWGHLNATAGALLKADWSELSIPRGAVGAGAGSFKGDGWTLELNPGWTLSRSGENGLKVAPTMPAATK